ncbi:MAG: DUF58 domain-containing protein [Myxococcota bacterium]
MARRAIRRGLKPTREGWALLWLTIGLGVAAAVTGNNVLVLLFAGTISLWVIDAVLGPWNLRHLNVRRELPAELFAETAARGGYRLYNRRKWLPSAGLVLTEIGGHATGTLERLHAGEEDLAGTAWTFQARGPVTLRGIRLTSAFPLGLWTRWVERPLAARLVVYPRPRISEPSVEGGQAGGDGVDPAGRGSVGDIDGLKAYQIGDSPGRIHWPTSARVGEPIVVIRTDENADRVTVRVRDLHGRAWENEVSRASGGVIRGFQRGCRVGLDLPDGRFKSGAGPAWRRTLLEALAQQPDRSS